MEFHFEEDKESFINQFLKHHKPSRRRAAKARLRQLQEYSEENFPEYKGIYDSKNPGKLREIIFSFFEDNPQGWTTIQSSYITPVKDYLTFLAERTDGNDSKNLLMVRDSLKTNYFKNGVPTADIEELDGEILTESEIKKLDYELEEEDLFILNLALETTAKKGVLATIRPDDIDTRQSKISLTSQYKQGLGEWEEESLNGPRKRPVDVSKGFIEIYSDFESSVDTEFLFGDTPEDSARRLEKFIRENEDLIESHLSFQVLRKTAALRKLDERNVSQVKHDMGLKTGKIVEKIDEVRKRRSS